EQIEGQQVDQRSDIFAFGAVVYEMATGRRAFSAKSRASMIAAILDSDPPPISSVVAAAPPALDRVVRTCLAKDPDDRFQTAHDVKVALQWIREERSSGAMPAPVVRRRAARERIAWTLAALIAVAAGVAIVLNVRAMNRVYRGPVFASILPPKNSRFLFMGACSGTPVLTRDGRRLAFVATAADESRWLWLRTLDEPEPRQLEGTQNAIFPFWSADGKSIGFFADGQLKRIDIAGGPPLTI